ncbi:hypothetical protein AB4510_01295 [Vibrio sp. 10N.222.54.B12]|uniref:hypothetical protein n=1 Tax=Vibrio sp. 10N.222.54.B12 TaxID=3229636 RepID=UPI00354F49A8
MMTCNKKPMNGKKYSEERRKLLAHRARMVLKAKYEQGTFDSELVARAKNIAAAREANKNVESSKNEQSYKPQYNAKNESPTFVHGKRLSKEEFKKLLKERQKTYMSASA